MARQARHPLDNGIYPVLNRGNSPSGPLSLRGGQSIAMVRQAQPWPWSSRGASAGSDGVKVQLTAWPVSRSPRWEQQVHEWVDARTLERVHLSIARGQPFGDDSWTARVARRHGLESTLHDPWRPRKAAKKEE